MIPGADILRALSLRLSDWQSARGHAVKCLMGRHSYRPASCLYCGCAFMARSDGQGRFCSRSCARRSRAIVDPVARFWSKVSKEEGDACWEWLGDLSDKGYGFFVLRHGVKVYAHRYSFELAHGPLAAGLQACHHCDNPPCVRPDHLFSGTQKDNIQDALSKGRMATSSRNGRHTFPERTARGVGHGRAKLTEASVQQILCIGGTMPQQKIADMFGTPQTNVSLILRRKAWAHIKPQQKNLPLPVRSSKPQR